ncbi:MAG: desulfoferrodoxin [Candidatus Nealsonbacteria bacterium DGGOD1a]|jgi:superoxide reductase|nr:MAG: desulfoferrodoxin [Candidatus Nealsonbacteria bacterium DGGOD1a]
MAQFKEIYKCAVCGNIVEVLRAGAGQLVCCGQPMELQVAKTSDEGTEKHLPALAELPANVCSGKDGVKIKIGAVEHPMTPEHYIEWIEIDTIDGKSGKKFLKPADLPESEFQTRMNIVGARAYCNVHGLWEIKIAAK